MSQNFAYIYQYFGGTGQQLDRSRQHIFTSLEFDVYMSKELSQLLETTENDVLDGESEEQIYGVRSGAPHLAPWPIEPCKIVFLDFDGVLNSEQSLRQLGTRFRFGESSISALNKVLWQTGARLVITSTWRAEYTLQEIVGLLERNGVLTKRVAGKTQILGKKRELEIDAWLRSVPYAVSSYVILDDNDGMVMHEERLVQVNPQVGLTSMNAERAIQLLSIPLI